ncbi:hypothetical protein GOA91_15135 [Sinorhizobium meliloti]|nr:hypothetical protein [Sinorhizobium meliloti]
MQRYCSPVDGQSTLNFPFSDRADIAAYLLVHCVTIPKPEPISAMPANPDPARDPEFFASNCSFPCHAKDEPTLILTSRLARGDARFQESTELARMTDKVARSVFQ